MGFEWGEIDHGWDDLLRTVKAMKNGDAYVKAGVLGSTSKREETGIDNVRLATIHEFGSPEAHVPERSFIRQPFDAHREAYFEMVRRLVAAIYEGKADIRQGLGRIGLKMTQDQRNRILKGAGVPPPNAPSTVEKKGSSRPLVDTGQLLRSLTHAVVMPSEGGE